MYRIYSLIIMFLISMYTFAQTPSISLNFNPNNSQMKLDFMNIQTKSEFWDSVSGIKTFSKDRIRRIFHEMSDDAPNDGCKNSLAITIMEKRIRVLREINQKYRYETTQWYDIDCVLYNFYLLTGFKPEGDGDLIGWVQLSDYAISQYEDWFNKNKKSLCVDVESGILYCRK